MYHHDLKGPKKLLLYLRRPPYQNLVLYSYSDEIRNSILPPLMKFEIVFFAPDEIRNSVFVPLMKFERVCYRP